MIKKFIKQAPVIRQLLEVKPVRNMIEYIRRIFNLRLVQGPLTYNQDGLATQHNGDFMKDKLFIEAYKLGEATYRGIKFSANEGKMHWRIHVLCWAASHAKHLEGDFVECGVYRGWFSRAVVHYVDFNRLNKKFYLLDTFCGFSEKYTIEEEKKLGRLPGSRYEECYEGVKKTFKDFPNVKIIRGPIPETLPQADTAKVSFLSIDMNCVTPEIAAAEFFWDKLVSGAVIVLDDYGWQPYFLQKKAFDKFAKEKGVEVLSLPTGQGLIFKP